MKVIPNIPVVWFITAFLSLAGIACGETIPATLTVLGQVKTIHGTPEMEASVFVVHRPQYSDYVVTQITTDRFGEFEVTDVPVGERVRFFAKLDGFGLGMVQQIFSNPSQEEPLEIVLRPAGMLRLTIANPEGKPLEGATMGSVVQEGPNAYLEPRLAELFGIPWPRSNSAGQIETSLFPDLASVSGEIRHGQFAAAKFTTVVSSGPSEATPVQLNEGIDFTLHVKTEGIEIPSGGWQLSMFREGDVAFTFNDEQIFLDKHGEFRVVVNPGTYGSIMLRHSKLQTLPGLFKDVRFEPKSSARIEITTVPRGSVTGRVVNGTTLKPLAGQTLQAFVFSSDHPADYYGAGPGWYYSARATTDDDGNYTIHPGAGPVRLIHRDRQWACEEPYTAINVTQTEQPTMAPDIRMRDGIRLTGLVTDQEGKPVSRAVLQPTGEQYFRNPVCCDMLGRFEYQVEDITKTSNEDPTGYIEMLLFDPYRPLSKQLQIPLDPRESLCEVNVRLESNPIAPVPTADSGEEFKKDSLAGKPAPELVFAESFGAENKLINLADHRGKFVLLHFWATWCGPCHRVMPTVELTDDLYADHGLTVIGVHHNSVPADAVEEFLLKHGPHHVTLLDTMDGDICKSYGIEVFPSYVLIGPDGTVVMTSNENRELLVGHLMETVRQFLSDAGKLTTTTSSAAR